MAVALPLATLIAAGAIGTAAAGQLPLDKAVASIVPRHETVVYLPGVDRATTVTPVHGRMSWHHRLSMTLDEAGLSVAYAHDTVRIGNPAAALSGSQSIGQTMASNAPGFSLMPYTPPAPAATPASSQAASQAAPVTSVAAKPAAAAPVKVAALQGKTADALNAEELQRTGQPAAHQPKPAALPVMQAAAKPAVKPGAKPAVSRKTGAHEAMPELAAARVPAPAPVQSQPVAPQQTWTLTPGHSYEVELQKWAKKAGNWQVRWDLVDQSGSKIDWIVPERIELTGSFRHVATEIIHGLRDQGATIHADIYPGTPYSTFVVDSPKENTNAN